MTDARGVAAIWNATAASSLIGTGTGTTAATAVGYSAGAVTTTGDIDVAANGASPADITGGPIVVSPTALSGNNSASWSPTLTVTMPAGALAGTYTRTVTTSVA